MRYRRQIWQSSRSLETNWMGQGKRSLSPRRSVLAGVNQKRLPQKTLPELLTIADDCLNLRGNEPVDVPDK
ncbi:hypothetical protein IQ267_18275 [filamentous cyanobacterium LEGE 07170]|nr:hypothetical protein [filamentous cyanobacterium LEGE 07170]